ncbi:MAG TPA: FtsX-like permease family protein, partial [Flavobacteriaceae bacterium]|nr:FtsX-like permease family protein [Flavobacteriaceae bacterium]
ANENFLGNSGLEVESGRNFSYFDIENNVNVCILGSDFKNALFSGMDPVGKTISVRGAKFKVIGILESKGSTFGNNEDLRVLIPIQIARSLFNQAYINYNISVKVDDKEMMEGAQDEAIITFRNIRKLQPKEDNNFGIRRSDSLINQILSITRYLNIAAFAISFITILGSSIALMNIMLVSVTERTREIGVRKALGAKKNTIAFQFFAETIIIGQMGGICGIIFGMLIGFLVASVADLSFSIPWLAIIIATAVSLAIAIISGLFPALKAAKQDPIESLRYE